MQTLFEKRRGHRFTEAGASKHADLGEQCFRNPTHEELDEQRKPST